MKEYTYVNEHGERWRISVDGDGIVRVGGDETDGEMMTVGIPTLGSTLFSWQEMAWLSTVMVQLELQKLRRDQLDSSA